MVSRGFHGNHRIILTATDAPMASAWKEFCDGLAGVTIHRGSIFDVQADAYVSPANSFGFMDGGIDLAYVMELGGRIERAVQNAICEEHFGELPVGQAVIVPTDHTKVPFLIAAPTMRVPMKLPKTTVNPYLAARAVLNLIHPKNLFTVDSCRLVSNVVRTVAFPGLGTGVGGVDPRVCARQVAEAIRRVFLGDNEFPENWLAAQTQHQRLYLSSATRDLQQPAPPSSN